MTGTRKSWKKKSPDMAEPSSPFDPLPRGKRAGPQSSGGGTSHADALHEVSRLYREHISPDLARLIKFGGPGTLEVEAHGCYVTDHLGRELLDLAGGYGVFNLGHRHPRVVQAVKDQLDLMPLSSRLMLNANLAYLARDLAALAPGALKFSFLCNSGTEAVEGALKLARMATNRTGFVAAEGSFHGKSMGSLSVTGRTKYRTPFEPLVPGVKFVPFGDVAALEQAIDDSTAGLILEPVQGEGGIHVAPPGYLSQASEICRERGALFIADEVQTGLGRTGRMFAVEHWGVEPDILVLAKALGGGVVPAGAFMGTPRVWAAYKGQPLIHTSTFGGNPLACVAARATLEALQAENLCERAARSGEILLNGLRNLQESYPDLIHEVRGLGLMIGLEMTSEANAGGLISDLVKANVLAVYTLNQPRVIRFEPPLQISIAQLEGALGAVAKALRSVRAARAPQPSHAVSASGTAELSAEIRF
jgi:putrescine aminotransferase